MLWWVDDAMLVALAAMLWLWLRRPAESVPPTPRIRHVRAGTPAPMERPVPRLLWSYWNSTEVPLVVQRCLANWRHHNPGWEIQLVGPATFDRYIDPADRPERFDQLTPARQSDWLRLYLLQRYGGVWIDASTILTRSLDWLVDAQADSGAHYLGFYLDRYDRGGEMPIVDSWGMAAPAGSAFVRAWYDELCTALHQGDEAYLRQLDADGQLARLRQGIADPAYLIIHICGQVVLDRQQGHHLQLWRAEDTAYHFQHHSRWRRLRLYRRLLLHPAPRQPPALVKLRGGERRKLEPYLQHGLYRRSSLVGQELMRAPPSERLLEAGR